MSTIVMARSSYDRKRASTNPKPKRQSRLWSVDISQSRLGFTKLGNQVAVNSVLISDVARLATKPPSHDAAQRQALWTIVSWCLTGYMLLNTLLPTTGNQGFGLLWQVVW